MIKKDFLLKIFFNPLEIFQNRAARCTLINNQTQTPILKFQSTDTYGLARGSDTEKKN